MKTIALIPARSGSKRVKDKNIRLLDGVPLFVWSIAVARQLGLDAVVLSTDSEEYAKIGTEAGSEVLMRDAEASSDNATDFPVIRQAFQAYGCDQVVYLRPTTPFRTVETCVKALKTVQKAGFNCSGLRSIEEMTESAWKAFELHPGPYLKPIASGMEAANLPNQLVKPTFKGNGYIDIVKKSTILQGSLWGERCIGFITHPAIEIDTERDLEFAQWWAKRKSLGEVVL